MADQKRTIVGFGDSITQAVEVSADKNWLALLKTLLQKRNPNVTWNFVNAGVGGNTSREGLARMEKDVLAHQPDIVLIEFGGNDATHEDARHVNLSEFEANLQTMRHRLQSITARPVLLTFPPLIDEWHAWGKHPFYASKNGLDRFIEQYRVLTRQFAERERLPLADIDLALREAVRKQKPEQFIRSCGVHLTEDGNRIVAETVFQTLTSAKPGIPLIA